jgi:hypothetical protein
MKKLLSIVVVLAALLIMAQADYPPPSDEAVRAPMSEVIDSHHRFPLPDEGEETITTPPSGGYPAPVDQPTGYSVAGNELPIKALRLTRITEMAERLLRSVTGR